MGRIKKRYDPHSLILGTKTGKKLDYYETPAYYTRALLKREAFSPYIYEPCCGNGSISKELIGDDYKVMSSDIQNYGYGNVKDFFEIETNITSLVTNPPYDKALDFILHSLKIVIGKMAFLLRLGFLESSKRYELLYKQYPPTKIYIFTRRISFLPDKPLFYGGMTVAWFVWNMRKYKKIPPRIYWINDEPEKGD